MKNQPTNQPPNQPETQPNRRRLDVAEIIPERARTWIYAAGVVLGLLTWFGSEVSQIWFPELAEQIIQTANRVLGFVAIVTGTLGTTYRPASFLTR